MHNLQISDWNDLRYFLAVAREGSTLAAAKVLHVNQSTVHRRLMALEQSLGCILTERHPTGYRLTEHGRQLQHHAEQVEDAVAALQRRVASLNTEVKGTIRLTCATGIAYLVIASKMLDSFHARHPQLQVELLMTEEVFDLSRGEADIAIRGGQPADEALFGRKIADVPWALYGSRSYVERHGSLKRPDDWTGHRAIEFIGDIAGIKAARWLQDNAKCAVVAGQSSNIPSALLAVKSGAGMALLPVRLAEREPDLVCVFGPVQELHYPMYLLTHRDLRNIPRIKTFFDFCVGALRPVLAGARKAD